MYRIAEPAWSRGVAVSFVHAGRARRLTNAAASTMTILPRSIRQWHKPGRPLPKLTKSFVDSPISRSAVDSGDFANWREECFAGRDFCDGLRYGQEHNSAQLCADAVFSLFCWTLRFFPIIEGICTKRDIAVPCKVAAGPSYSATAVSVIDEPSLIIMPQVPEGGSDLILRACVDVAMSGQRSNSNNGGNLVSDPNRIWSMLVAVAGPESVTFQLVEFDQSLLTRSVPRHGSLPTGHSLNSVTYKPAAASSDGALSYFNRDSRLAIGRLLADVAAATEGRVDEWVSKPKSTNSVGEQQQRHKAQ